jgi:threonyl-tRNA synthetase
MMAEFKAAGIRVAIDDADETVGNKVRKAAAQKIPYIIVAGDKELGGEDLMIRVRGQEAQDKMSKAAFLEKVRKEIVERL